MRITLALLFCLVFTGVADAQQCWRFPNYRHASTAAEGYLSGRARLVAARGFYLNNLGDYLMEREAARRMHVDNWAHYARTRWSVRDEYFERLREKHPDYVTRENARLDMAIKLHELKLRKQKLIDEGIIPKPPEPYMGWNGKRYPSYQAFKESPDYATFQAEVEMRQFRKAAEKAAAEVRHKRAVAFGAMWDKMSYVEKDRWKRMSSEEKDDRFHRFLNPEYDKKRLLEAGVLKFYQNRPYLIPMAGKDGLPPLPE